MLKRLRRTDDQGAVAVIVAIAALMLMALGAVAVDLGNAWARKRTVQTSADLAALAGAAGLPDITEARTLALDYLRRNNTEGTTLPPCAVTSATAPTCWDNDDDYANGEIDFYGNDTNGDGRYEQTELTVTSGQAFAIRVIPPGAKVDFGLAGAVGFSSTTVTTPATAAIGSPLGLGIPPFYLTTADNGPTCIKDDAPGVGGSPSVVPRWAVRSGHSITGVTPTSAAPGDQVTVSGLGLPAGGGDKVRIGGQNATVISRSSTSWTVVVPSLPPGAYDIVIPDGNGPTTHDATKTGFVVTAAAPTTQITGLSPSSGAAGSTFQISGTNLPNNNSWDAYVGGVLATVSSRSDTAWTVVVPTGVSGPVPVDIRKNSTTYASPAPFTVTVSPPPAAPVLTSLDPDFGAAGTTVRINGTGLPGAGGTATFGGVGATVTSRSTTQWVVTVPPGLTVGATVNVVVNNGSASNALGFLVLAADDPCNATSSNRGYIDEPRFSGNAQSIELNIKHGLDHHPHEYMRFPGATPDTYGAPDDGVVRAEPGTDIECPSLPPATVFQSGPATPIPDINCARLKSGGTGGQLKPGFFDTSSGDEGRLLQKNCAATTTTSGPVSGVDNASLSQFIDTSKGTYDQFKAYVTANPSITPADSKAGWVRADILDCPRFAILPVVNSAFDTLNGTRYFPIIGFRAVYFWDDSPYKGFVWNGSNLKAVRAWVFDLDYLPPQVSAEVAGAIGGYLGSGPKVVRLVHDQGDPAT